VPRLWSVLCSEAGFRGGGRSIRLVLASRFVWLQAVF
jgi:hypothetical protein